MSRRQLAILGAPGTGKTTYLAALSRSLSDRRTGALRLSSVARSTHRADELIEALDAGAYPPRTQGEQGPVEMELTGRSGEAVSLDVVDYAGEAVDRLFDARDQWTAAWRARARADALLIFFAPDYASLGEPDDDAEATSWADAWHAVRAHRAGAHVPRMGSNSPRSAVRPEQVFGTSGLDEGEARAPRRGPLDPVVVPASIPTIELIQFVRDERGLAPGERPARGALRVAAVLTCWDRATAAWRRAGPMRLLGRAYPLLGEVLWSNFHGEDIGYFGLSSTGGDLNDPTYKRAYVDGAGGCLAWSDLHGRTRTTDDLSLLPAWALLGHSALSAE